MESFVLDLLLCYYINLLKDVSIMWRENTNEVQVSAQPQYWWKYRDIWLSDGDCVGTA